MYQKTAALDEEVQVFFYFLLERTGFPNLSLFWDHRGYIQVFNWMLFSMVGQKCFQVSSIWLSKLSWSASEPHFVAVVELEWNKNQVPVVRQVSSLWEQTCYICGSHVLRAEKDRYPAPLMQLVWSMQMTWYAKTDEYWVMGPVKRLVRCLASKWRVNNTWSTGLLLQAFLSWNKQRPLKYAVLKNAMYPNKSSVQHMFLCSRAIRQMRYSIIHWRSCRICVAVHWSQHLQIPCQCLLK